MRPVYSISLFTLERIYHIKFQRLLLDQSLEVGSVINQTAFFLPDTALGQSWLVIGGGVVSILITMFFRWLSGTYP